MSSLTSGLIRGYVESVVSTGISQGLQHAGGVTPGSTAGSILDGVTGGGVRLRASRYGGRSWDRMMRASGRKRGVTTVTTSRCLIAVYMNTAAAIAHHWQL